MYAKQKGVISMSKLLKVIFSIINLSGIIAGIWLLCLGEWKLVLYSILFLILSKYMIAFLLTFCWVFSAPSLLLAALVYKRNNFWGKFLTFLFFPLATIAHPLAVATFGSFIFYWFYYPNTENISIYPLLLLVLALGTAPWNWYARQENTDNAFLSGFVSELMFFVVCVIMLFNPIPLPSIFLIFFFGQLVHPILALCGSGLFKRTPQKKKLTPHQKIKNICELFLHLLAASATTILLIYIGIFVYTKVKQNLTITRCDLSQVSLWENAKKDQQSYKKLKQCLIEQEDINIFLDKYHTTPLTGATELCIPELVKTVIDLGADVNHKDKFGMSPLLLATYCEDTKIAELLLQNGAGIMSSGINPITFTSNNKKMIALLQRYGSDINQNADKECFRSLLAWQKQNDNDVSIWMKNCTPLMNLSASPKISKDTMFQGIQTLIESGANTEIKDSAGVTALFIAVQMENINAVNVLIKNGADVNVQDKVVGFTPLRIAIMHENKDIFDALLEKRPEIFSRDEKGKIIGLKRDVFGRTMCEHIVNIKNPKIKSYFIQRLKEVYQEEFSGRVSGKNHCKELGIDFDITD